MMNDNEADPLYDLMPQSYRQRVTREQFRILFSRLIKPVVAGSQHANLPGTTGAGRTPRGVRRVLRPKSPVSRNGLSDSLTTLPVPAVYLRPPAVRRRPDES
jgi:hypothetical protein